MSAPRPCVTDPFHSLNAVCDNDIFLYIYNSVSVICSMWCGTVCICQFAHALLQNSPLKVRGYYYSLVCQNICAATCVNFFFALTYLPLFFLFNFIPHYSEKGQHKKSFLLLFALRQKKDFPIVRLSKVKFNLRKKSIEIAQWLKKHAVHYALSSVSTKSPKIFRNQAQHILWLSIWVRQLLKMWEEIHEKLLAAWEIRHTGHHAANLKATSKARQEIFKSALDFISFSFYFYSIFKGCRV